MTFMLKSILAIVLVVLGLINVVTMLEVMGRPKPGSRAKSLRLIHKLSGACFIILLLVLAYVGTTFLDALGREPGPRVVLHILLAVSALLTLCFKVAFIRLYRKFLASSVPLLGILLFCLTAAATALTAGYFFIVEAGQPHAASIDKGSTSSAPGMELFRKKCAGCHYPDKKKAKIGPGLKDLFKRDKLQSSGVPPTGENIRKQIRTPAGSMPPFADLTESEIESLIGYLRTL